MAAAIDVSDTVGCRQVAHFSPKQEGGESPTFWSIKQGGAGNLAQDTVNEGLVIIEAEMNR